MKPDRAPSSFWPLRRNYDAYVTTSVGDTISIIDGAKRIDLDRATARLLAKRINQCLDATAQR